MGDRIWKITLGSNLVADQDTFIGGYDDLWLRTDDQDGIYRGDGVTPGGIRINGGGSSTLFVTQSDLDAAISELVNGADAAFDTLKEIQDAMATDTELATAISNLVIPSDISDLTDTTNLLVHFSGDYNDLTNKPVLFSGSYNDLTDTPTLATVATTGDYNDLINLPNITGAQTLQDVTDLGSTTTNKVALADGITLDATNASYIAQPAINKVDYFDRNMDINTPADGDIYDVQNPWKVDKALEQTAGMKTNTMDWAYQSLTGEPILATQQIMGVISDQGSRNGKFIIGNISMVGGIGEPVWTIGYVDEGDDHGAGPYDLGDPKNMYKVGDGTNTNGLLTNDFKPILQLEPSGTIAAVRGKNTSNLNDPDRVSHNAGSLFEGFFNGDIKPVMRIQGTNDPINKDKNWGGGLIQFGRAGLYEPDFHINRWTIDQTNVKVNGQSFMNWVNNPTWRRGLVMENGTATYWIGEGNKVVETFTATTAQQTFTVTQDLTGDFEVRNVFVNGVIIGSSYWTSSGQDVTILELEVNDGHTFVGGETVRIEITDSNRNREIKAVNLWNNANSRSELTVTGGIIRVSDLVNNAGVSAFGGGGMEVTTLNDANDANPSEPSVAFNLGTANWPTGTQYGQTLTVTGDGDTAFQVTSGFGNDSVYFRAGNPESPTGGWNSWYQVASREWVNAQGFGTGSSNLLIQDLNDANVVDFTKPSVSFNTGTANFPAGTQYGQTLTVTGNGDTQWQMTSGFNDDQIWFRTGNPEKPTTGTWKNWVQIASRNYVDDILGAYATNTDMATQDNLVQAAAEAYTDAAIAALPGGSSWTEDLNATVNATAGSKTFVDTSGQTVTVILPATPSMGDEVKIIDANGNAGTNNITVQGNGENIMGSASDLIIDRDGAGFTLVYYNATRGWVLAEN